jgi:hypothetical protein
MRISETKLNRAGFLSLVLALLLILSACGAPQTESINDDETPLAQYEAARTVEFQDSVFNKDKAEVKNDAYIDISNASKGYAAVSAKSEKRLKLQVVFGETKYNYDIPNDGTPSIIPLQFGNGKYKLRVMRNTTDKKYTEINSVTVDAVMDNEFTAFVRPNIYVNYKQTSACIKKAGDIAVKAKDDLAVISGVYDYVTKNVKYDKEKAASVKSGYVPDPDETMSTGKGICFDYASLAASMLRSQGIPVKLIFGYVAPNNLYHAWNMFYTEKTGWVTVKFEAKGEQWTRMDLTFSAGGASANFVGDGTNYSDLYFY